MSSQYAVRWACGTVVVLSERAAPDDEDTTSDGKASCSKGNHSPARRGVGFYLQAQFWAIGAAPSVVRFGRQVAELYLGEFDARFNGLANTFPRQLKQKGKL